MKHCFRAALRLPFIAVVLAVLLSSACRRGPLQSGEIMYVSAPQANLRDQVAAVYNKVGTLKNGERVEIIDHQKRFVKVRTDSKQEGWVELRNLVSRDTYEQFQKLAKDNKEAPSQGRGATRSELNMHTAPGRETDTLYQLAEGEKVELIRRATAVRATPEEIQAKRAAALAKAAGETPKPAPKPRKKTDANKPADPNAQGAKPDTASTTKAGSKDESKPEAKSEPKTDAKGDAKTAAQTPPAEEPKPKPMDDWWLVRNSQGRVGWVLARMIDVDIPLDIAQYAEGQRILGAYVLNTVDDEEKGKVPQYVVVLNDNRDGIPYDFNQVRVFTWNLKRHRYETGYRERNIIGYFPVRIGTEDFGKEGVMPVFTLKKQNEDGSMSERKYRLMGPIVRQVLAPGEQPPKAAQATPTDPNKAKPAAKAHPKRARAGRKHR